MSHDYDRACYQNIQDTEHNFDNNWMFKIIHLWLKADFFCNVDHYYLREKNILRYLLMAK